MKFAKPRDGRFRPLVFSTRETVITMISKNSQPESPSLEDCRHSCRASFLLGALASLRFLTNVVINVATSFELPGVSLGTFLRKLRSTIAAIDEVEGEIRA